MVSPGGFPEKDLLILAYTVDSRDNNAQRIQREYSGC